MNIDDCMSILQSRADLHAEAVERGFSGASGEEDAGTVTANKALSEECAVVTTAAVAAVAAAEDDATQTLDVPGAGAGASAADINTSITQPSIDIDAIVEDLSQLDIITRFCLFQEERVRTYDEFSNRTKQLVVKEALDQYPNMVTEITTKFNSISKEIIRLKNNATRQGFSQLTQFIVDIQGAEREKLLLVAARQLDVIQDHLVVLQVRMGGRSQKNRDYLQEQILAIESKIRDFMENVMSMKSDLLFG